MVLFASFFSISTGVSTIELVVTERVPIISDLFPVGKEVALDAFGKLRLPDNSSDFMKIWDEEKPVLQDTNPYLLGSLEEDIESDRLDVTPKVWGSMLCIYALREKARMKEVAFPTFTRKFVDTYNREKDRKLEKGDTEGLSLSAMASRIRRLRVSQFRNHEEEFSGIVEERLRGGSDWRPEDDSRYMGIVNMYLLIRAGCENPQNYKPKT